MENSDFMQLLIDIVPWLIFLGILWLAIWLPTKAERKDGKKRWVEIQKSIEYQKEQLKLTKEIRDLLKEQKKKK